MSSQTCVNCYNKKPVNQTTNRLVTESCGHVKCMDCLLKETSGCEACIREKNAERSEENIDESSLLSQATVTIQSQEGSVVAEDGKNKPNIKKKLSTTHIHIEADADGLLVYTCTVCNKKFHARSQVSYHAYCNGQRKPYQCPECNKSFATHSHFKYHMRVHRNERTYACDICGDSFFQMSKLQRHKLKHTKEKKYACTECGKAFNNFTSLRKHGLTHTEERPYSCAVCGRCFRDGSNYRKHVAKHEGCKNSRAQLDARAFQCPRCPQAFRSKKDMRRHSMVHSDSKPFRCKVCNRRFRRKDNLERHIRNTHRNYVTSSAIEIDEMPADMSPVKNKDSIINGCNTPEDSYSVEKSKLEILNPLPPLSSDVIKKHINEEPSKKPDCNGQFEYEVQITREVFVEKSYILEANNARESVIFGPVKKEVSDSKKEPDIQEYVHKKKKPNCWWASKDLSLPPVNEEKCFELEKKTCLSNVDVVVPPKNLEVYKKILYLERPNDAPGDEAKSKKRKIFEKMNGN